MGHGDCLLDAEPRRQGVAGLRCETQRGASEPAGVTLLAREACRSQTDADAVSTRYARTRRSRDFIGVERETESFYILIPFLL